MRPAEPARFREPLCRQRLFSSYLSETGVVEVHSPRVLNFPVRIDQSPLHVNNHSSANLSRQERWRRRNRFTQADSMSNRVELGNIEIAC